MNILKSKKAANAFEYWVEYLAAIIVVFGFLLSIILGSAFVVYATIFLCGITTGRLWYKRKGKFNTGYVAAVVAFIVGYTLGVRYGNGWIVLFLFLLSHFLTAYLYETKKLKY